MESSSLEAKEPKKPETPLLQPSPVRILVQTLTHLVPMDGVAPKNDPASDKLISMLHRICQFQWNCKYTAGVHRWYTYGDEFGYNNRLCFFLIDYGTTSNDDDVPTLCYEWTGESLYDQSSPNFSPEYDCVNI
jgi:hypothetical protein